MFRLAGLLDHEGGSYVRCTLESLMGMPKAGDERTTAQRRADALVDLARQRLQGRESQLGKTGGQRPHLTVTAPLATLRAEIDAPAGELAGFPIPTETVRRLSCDASLTPVVVNGAGDSLHVGRARRTVPPALRRALVLRDRCCQFPGCTRPAEWCDGHHIKHWADGGVTSKENGTILCHPHHRMVHEGGWRLYRDETGKIVAVPPPCGEAAALPCARAPAAQPA
jgi:hypothetical protein